MKIISSFILATFGVLIENTMAKYLLVDLGQESQVGRGPGKMTWLLKEMVILHQVYLINSTVLYCKKKLFSFLYLLGMCSVINCPGDTLCNPITLKCDPGPKGISEVFLKNISNNVIT